MKRAVFACGGFAEPATVAWDAGGRAGCFLEGLSTAVFRPGKGFLGWTPGSGAGCVYRRRLFADAMTYRWPMIEQSAPRHPDTRRACVGSRAWSTGTPVSDPGRGYGD